MTIFITITLFTLLSLSFLLCFAPNNFISVFLFDKMEKRFFVSSIFPVFGTLFLTIILNLALIKIDYFNINIWETILLELFFGVQIFFLVDKMQENLSRATFEETLYNFFESMKDSHWVEKKFAKEFFKGVFRTRYYLEYAFAKEATKVEEVRTQINSLETILAGLNNNGIELSNYLYSRLLYNCLLSNNIEKIFSIWDVEMVGLKVEEYSDYAEKLSSIYSSILEVENKQRVFVFIDEAHFQDITESNALWNDIQRKHKEWKFSKIHYCFNSQLTQVKEGKMEGIKRLEDFLLCSNTRNKKWGAGKDKDNGRVFFHSNPKVMKETEQIFKLLINIANKNYQFIELT